MTCFIQLKFLELMLDNRLFDRNANPVFNGLPGPEQFFVRRFFLNSPGVMPVTFLN